MDRDDERPRSVLDEQAARLRAARGGWRITWYVRSAVTRASSGPPSPPGTR